MPPHLRRVAVVFQDYSLFPHLRVLDNVLFGTPAAEADLGRAREVLAMCRLEGLDRRYPHQLSGGQQQRVALARALVTQPRVLLLDEPFSALDSNVREKLQMDLLRLQQRLGLTIIHVTHDLREALVLADRIAVLHEGRVVQVGDKDEVLRRPANEAAARFLGTRNMLTGHVVAQSGRGTLVRTGSLSLWTPARALAVGTPVQVFVRPEEISPLWDGPHLRGTGERGRSHLRGRAGPWAGLAGVPAVRAAARRGRRSWSWTCRPTTTTTSGYPSWPKAANHPGWSWCRRVACTSSPPIQPAAGLDECDCGCGYHVSSVERLTYRPSAPAP